MPLIINDNKSQHYNKVVYLRTCDEPIIGWTEITPINPARMTL